VAEKNHTAATWKRNYESQRPNWPYHSTSTIRKLINMNRNIKEIFPLIFCGDIY